MLFVTAITQEKWVLFVIVVMLEKWVVFVMIVRIEKRTLLISTVNSYSYQTERCSMFRSAQACLSYDMANLRLLCADEKQPSNCSEAISPREIRRALVCGCKN